MNADRVRKQLFPPGADNHYTRVLADGKLAGYALAARWPYVGQTICWITQLCVDPKYRRRGLATKVRPSAPTHLFTPSSSPSLMKTFLTY